MDMTADNIKVDSKTVPPIMTWWELEGSATEIQMCPLLVSMEKSCSNIYFLLSESTIPPSNNCILGMLRLSTFHSWPS